MEYKKEKLILTLSRTQLQIDKQESLQSDEVFNFPINILYFIVNVILKVIYLTNKRYFLQPNHSSRLNMLSYIRTRIALSFWFKFKHIVIPSPLARTDVSRFLYYRRKLGCYCKRNRAFYAFLLPFNLLFFLTSSPGPKRDNSKQRNFTYLSTYTYVHQVNSHDVTTKD